MKSKKRRLVRGECPQCACGDVSFIPPEELKEKYSGPEDQIEILCPACGTKIKGQLEIEGEERQKDAKPDPAIRGEKK